MLRSGYGSARQGPDLELLEPEHRSNPLFDAAMILLHHIAHVFERSYPYTVRYRSL